MADQNEYTGKFEPGRAATSPISLSQALLAPLDAIFKAQIHAARSFLNLVLQIGYPHQALDKDGIPKKGDGKPYNQEFLYDVEIDGKLQRRKVSVPALALVPVAPLAVESAAFKLAMRVSHVCKHNQIQESEEETIKGKEEKYDRNKRPWFLVPDPISIRGTIAPSRGNAKEEDARTSTIEIEVKVGKIPMPSGLDKLLTFLTQSSYVSGGGKEAKDQQ